MPSIHHSMSLPDLHALHAPNQVLRSSTSHVLISHTTNIERIATDLAAHIRHDAPCISGKQATELLEGATRALDAYQAQMLDTLPHDGQQIVLTVEHLIADPAQALNRTQPGTASHVLAEEALSFFQEREATQGGAPLTSQERSIAMMDLLGAWLRKTTNNEFEGNFGRWMANASNVGIRTGLIVGLTTTVRQLIGFGIEKASMLGDLAIPSRAAVGAAAMLLGPGLNLAGFIRDEINQTATVQSRGARVAMALLSAGAIVASAHVGDPSALSSLMSSFGPQMASYCLARDLAQAFFPLHDNAPINLEGTLAQTLLYGGVQMAVGEGMDALAPDSGAGYVMGAAAQAARARDASDAPASIMENWFTHTADGPVTLTPAGQASTESIRDRVHDAVRALQPALGDDVMRGVLNASAEIADDLLRPGISRAIQVNRTQSTVRRQAIAEGRDPAAALAELPRAATEGLRVSVSARIPDRTQLANQLLTTNAMRTSAFEAIMGAAMTAASALGHTNLSAADQGHVINAVVAGMAALIYPPLIYAHAQRSAPATVATASGTVTNQAQEPAIELISLRQRRTSPPPDNH